MTEQKREKKTWSIIRRIIKWIGLSLLTILLVLALIFQAPWKVNVLLAIFLAACTLLPKRFRKWFWLSVGAVVIALIAWVLLPEDNEGWRPYTFDEELAAFEAEYAIPDEENAAFAYDEIFETVDIDSNLPEFFTAPGTSSLSGPWLSKDHPETAGWLKGRQDTIAKLLQAVRKDKCHFPISPHIWDFDRNAKRLAPTRKYAFLLVSAGNNDIGEGRKDEALEKYLCILRIADHLYQQPVAIDFLVGTALESLALTQLNRFVIESKPTAEQLRLITNALGDLENNWGSEFKKFLEYDRLFNKNNLCSLVYEVNSQGKGRFSRNPLALFEAVWPQEMPRLTYWQRKLCKAWTIFNWFIMPSIPQKAAEILDASFDRYDAMTKPGFDWTKQPQKLDSLITRGNFNRIKLNFRYLTRFMADLAGGTYFGLHDAYLRMLALRRCSRLLVAIKQYHNDHGAWPPNLDAIKTAAPAEAFIDPVTGNPLQYENLGERFSLKTETVNVWPK